MGKPRGDTDTAQDLARELADLSAQLASLKGEANVWLSDESYGALRHRLESRSKVGGSIVNHGDPVPKVGEIGVRAGLSGPRFAQKWTS